MQMQMSLGQEVQKKCKQCGMEYTASSIEDRRLHDKFHKQNTEGYDVGKNFVAQTDRTLQLKVKSDGDAILRVNCFDKHHRQKKAQAALEIVQRELGAVPIPEVEIWGKEATKAGVSNCLQPKFDAFMYVREGKCIGYCLTEHIEEAFESALAALRARKQCAAQELAEAEQNPIKLSPTTSPAVMGISRIWTSSTHRGQGIAKSLLDIAVSAYNVKEIESKDQVAFSQPTESGAKLARRWFGKPYGWKIYVD
ncbi:hypothetical protein DOTSEDRAFT_91148 [Dothistroma septosporum NZE10]|uniref:N-acetyltransferase domain-containing protein n=1 Tax=Dothistroma septosporum (strain NZE10 / CBS 128990) TaxID=675120 RepID=N1PBT5_DOTSN|nr:hypothetical protein DOTSEDRAFT_91148 [Dothistroma septosporum NZE10]